MILIIVFPFLFSFLQSVEQAVLKRFDDKYQRTMANLEKLKKEMRNCFESLEGSVKSLQRITDGRIKVTEEKLDKEVEKMRSTVVLIQKKNKHLYYIGVRLSNYVYLPLNKYNQTSYILKNKTYQERILNTRTILISHSPLVSLCVIFYFSFI